MRRPRPQNTGRPATVITMSANPNFPANLDIKPLRVDGDNLAFDEASQAEAIRKYGIAGRVWEAANALKAYIEGTSDLEFDPPFLQTKDQPALLLELGSGMGVVASAIARHLTQTKFILFVTDLPDVCPLLEKNLANVIRHISTVPASSHPAGSVLVRPLEWGNEQHVSQITNELSRLSPHSHYLTHIICSDLVYFPELLAPLLRALIHVTSPPLTPPHGSGHLPKVIISYKIRSLSKETAFWSAFGLWFSFDPVLIRSCHQTEDDNDDADGDSSPSGLWTRFGASGDGDVFVFVATRRMESFDWVVPSADKDLLEGVGARGSNTRKGDDTFEQLLLMRLDI
ncbi:putative methyltransferase-domain-containing protein [Irpex rosettiformis]|uniref:Methyltransferase-domain-containing protein n=1 Tax=Irpex rosettiformis TaxID=378272 RepID=A0ACB8UAW1_9APHY|nr:putative methyltransferase-domain-containing protein [Irpex rosettiformis]